MRRNLVLGLLLSLFGLTACGPGSGSTDQAPAPAVSPSTTTAAPAATPEPPAKPMGAIWFEPAALSACGKPEKVVVHWDARAFPDVKAVDIMGVKKDGTEALFLAAGRRGERETGAWMRGGSEMILRNKASGDELARAQIERLPCN